jgi:hypothetical protein
MVIPSPRGISWPRAGNREIHRGPRRTGQVSAIGISVVIYDADLGMTVPYCSICVVWLPFA